MPPTRFELATSDFGKIVLGPSSCGGVSIVVRGAPPTQVTNDRCFELCICACTLRPVLSGIRMLQALL